MDLTGWLPSAVADAPVVSTIEHASAAAASPPAEPAVPGGLTHGALVAHLQRLLPAAMIPTVFTIFSELPLTPAGKIDRGGLDGGTPLPRPPERSGPRDSLEAQIHQIWCDVLGVEAVDIQADFFLCGGHSLRAITLAARLEHAYGAGIPVRVIFDRRTIEQQAAFIRQERASALPGCVVPLRPAGTARALFCVHPGGGLVQVYTDLMAALDPRRPIYGLQSQGFAAGEAPLRRIEDMAARYVAEIKTVQASGPYHLAGLSSGCVIAYEMARQLAAAGERVGLVAMLDGGPVATPIADSDEDWQREIAAWIDRYPAMRAAVELGIPEAEMLAMPAEARLTRYLAGAQQTGVVPRDVTRAQFERFVHVFGSNVLALYRYQPRPYDGPLTVLGTNRPGNDALGWRDVAPRVQVHHVPGTHTTFFRRPHVQALAALLEREMTDD
jgi:thioesterase domain-containing protein/acyl carrier protein